jgi:radical SAM superfamily enzyme YgiQ (UPF0313 family)
MKIVFVAVPYIETDQPIMAPAVLKSIAESQGHQSTAMDMNIMVRNKILSYPADVRDALVNFFIHKKFDDQHLAEIIYTIVDQQTDEILNCEPDLVGLSLLTWQSQMFAKLLAMNLKYLRPDLKILMGGPGMKNDLISNDTTYCEGLKNLGLIDHYITGDGEQALIEYLKGNLTYPGIDSNSWLELNDLDQWPWPDYSDYDFSAYEGYNGKVRMPISDSRGCVRTCEFCDIIEHWKKYRYRSAESLWKEMLHQISQYGITHFAFNNSLTNGNMKIFNQLLDMMVEYNKFLPATKQISWSGYFIIRSAQQHPEELWQKLSQSNATLMLGVESAIHRVRYEIGKKFKNEDIDWHLEMGQKYQVPMLVLMIVAYPSETIDDFEFTKQWFLDRIGYAQNSVIGVVLSYSSIIPDTTLARKAEEYGINLGKYPTVWFNKRLGISAEQKAQYMQQLTDICTPFNQATIIQKNLKDQVLAAINPAKEFAHEIE